MLKPNHGSLREAAWVQLRSHRIGHSDQGLPNPRGRRWQICVDALRAFLLVVATNQPQRRTQSSSPVAQGVPEGSHAPYDRRSTSCHSG